MEEPKNDNIIIGKVVEIIHQKIGNNCKIFLFGSRVDGTASSRSDYDVGILSDEIIPQIEMIEIKEEIENLPTLFSIDVVDFKNVSENFYNVAMKNIINL